MKLHHLNTLLAVAGSGCFFAVALGRCALLVGAFPLLGGGGAAPIPKRRLLHVHHVVDVSKCVIRHRPAELLSRCCAVRAKPATAAEEAIGASRRDTVQGGLAAALSLVLPPTSSAAATAAVPTSGGGGGGGEQITIPLQYNGESYVLYYRVGGDLFRAVLDTGSPFLTIPGTQCDRIAKSKWGCYRPESSIPSGLRPTYELFDGVEGEVQWRSAPFSFVNATGSMLGPPRTVFGVLSNSLMSGPGGVFFGLVRDTEGWIRPSFLGQTSVTAFEIDLLDSSMPKTLTLSTEPLIAGSAGRGRGDGDYIPLVKDLRRFGDPTLHYTARPRAVTVNGSPLAADGKPIYAIFDTGVTGMVVSSELFDERYAAARRNREKSLWGEVVISFRSKMGKTVEVVARKPLTTPLGKSPWKIKGHLIVMGLSFLDGSKLTIDIDGERLWIES